VAAGVKPASISGKGGPSPSRTCAGPPRLPTLGRAGTVYLRGHADSLPDDYGASRRRLSHRLTDLSVFSAQ